MVKKIDFALILFSFLLLILIVTLSIFAVSGVVYADSSVGVVGDNLFTNPNFNLQDNNLFSFQNKFSQDIVYTNGATLTLDNGVLKASTTVGGTGHWIAFLFKPSIVGTYTFTINADFVGLSGYLWRLRDTNYTTYVDSQSQNFNNYQYVTFNITDLSKNYILQMVMPTADVSTNIYWVKFEYGSSFTGYVSDNYSNFGYNQGYQRGLVDGVVQYGFKYNDRLDYYSVINSRSDNGSYNLEDELFVLSGNTYGFGDDYIVSNYNPPLEGNNINTICAFHDLLVDSVHYNPGFKYVSDSEIVGSILINMPWVDVTNNSVYKPIQVAFVGRNTGSVNYVNVNDTLHWHNSGFYGTMTDTLTYNIYNVSISYVATEPVDIYFVPDNYYSNVTDLYIYFPVLWSNFAVYYGVDENSLNYNSGYNSGYDNGYNSGYATGKTVGYNQGYSAADDFYKQYGSFSFADLFTSAIDAPISVLGQALEFEVFGYNLKSFLFAILGVAIALLVIKMFI